MKAALLPGFADPVHDAQRTFRQLLDAMSRPGRIVEIAARTTAPGLAPAAAATALSLCDFETPVWLDGGTASAADWLRFHCGAPIVDRASDASFAFLRRLDALPPLDAFALGTDEYPDRAATLVIEVRRLAAGGGLRLGGPGIDGAVRLEVDGLGPAFWRERAALADLFPRGIDLALTCGRTLTALPRTTIVEG
jgi:alpha-D-ribose 1-methylphosphonate 5-triphosphate synthase subunit PhnH